MFGVLTFFLQLFLRKFRVLLGDGSLRHRENGKALALLIPLFNGLHHLVDVVGDLGKQDNIRAGSNARVEGQPSDLMPHNFHDKDTVVRSRRRVNTVDGVAGHVDSALKSEGHVGSVNIIVDGLGQMNHVQPFFPQQIAVFCVPFPPRMTRQFSFSFR